MLRRSVTPRMVTVFSSIVLLVITMVYWRLLVYREPQPMGRPEGFAGQENGPPVTMGREDVLIETLAGTVPGFEDGPAWRAQFSGPNALALEPDGGLLVADSRNHRIRRVTPTGDVTTVAGGGPSSAAGGRADGPALEARFSYPSGVALGADGTVYISDTGNGRVCALKDGQVVTVAGGAAAGRSSPGSDAGLRCPAAIAVDGEGNLWVSDLAPPGPRIRCFDRGGREIAAKEDAVPPDVEARIGPRAAMSDRPGPAPIAASPDGRGFPVITVYTLDHPIPASMRDTSVLMVDPVNHVLLGHRGDEPLLLLAGRMITGIRVPGTMDGPGNRASFGVPCAVVQASAGVAYVADYEGNRIRRVRLPAWWVAGRQVPSGRRSRMWRLERGN